MTFLLDLYQQWHPHTTITEKLKQEIYAVRKKISDLDALKVYLRENPIDFPLLCALTLDKEESPQICAHWNSKLRLEPYWIKVFATHVEQLNNKLEGLVLNEWVKASNGSLSILGAKTNMWMTKAGILQDFIEKPHDPLVEPNHPNAAIDHLKYMMDMWESGFDDFGKTIDIYIPQSPDWVWPMIASTASFSNSKWTDMLYSDGALSKLAIYPNAYASVAAAVLRGVSKGHASHQDGARKCDIRNIIKEIYAKNPKWIQQADPEIQHYLLATMVHVWPIAYPPHNNLFINYEQAWTAYRKSWEEQYTIMQALDTIDLDKTDDRGTAWLHYYVQSHQLKHATAMQKELSIDDLNMPTANLYQP